MVRPILLFLLFTIISGESNAFLAQVPATSQLRKSYRSVPGLKSVTSNQHITDNPYAGSDDQGTLEVARVDSDDFLEDAIHKNSTAAASALLSLLSTLRQRNSTSEQQESFLNNLLANGPDAPLPLWARFRHLAKYSKRARMYSLRRTLNYITPPVSIGESAEVKLQQRRRALVSLLRSLSVEEIGEELSDRPAIVILESKAKQDSRDAAKDLVSRRPPGLETPDYDVVATGEDLVGKMKGLNIEIRCYKPYSVCSVSMNQPRPDDSSRTDAKLGAPELKGASSFGALAGYLFGKNLQSTAMKMTTPVFTTGLVENTDGSEDQEISREMQFVLPSEYWGSDNLQKAPVPLEESGVSLRQIASENRAVLMFSGYASTKETKKRTKQLLSVLSRNGIRWGVVPNTECLAQYNDPFTLPWRRVNEISVKVEPK
jgi:hypothetical protein